MTMCVPAVRSRGWRDLQDEAGWTVARGLGSMGEGGRVGGWRMLQWLCGCVAVWDTAGSDEAQVC